VVDCLQVLNSISGNLGRDNSLCRELTTFLEVQMVENAVLDAILSKVDEVLRTYFLSRETDCCELRIYVQIVMRSTTRMTAEYHASIR
jgi:hypothetical protein